jgi:hypothetical protein
MKTGVELIAIERQEQIEKHGYDRQFVEDHPEYYQGGELAFVAEMLLASEHEEGIDPNIYPEGWEEDCDRMLAKSYIDRLIIAGALIAAEIDRVNNK